MFSKCRAEDAERPRLLCLMQLPPPVHGASLVSETVAGSAILAEAFQREVLPLRFASSLDDIGRIRPRKLLRAATTAARLAKTLAVHKPKLAYFTLSPTGGAFYRDCVYVGILKAFGIPRVYHLHAKGIQSELTPRWKRRLYEWAFADAHVIHLSARLAGDLDSLVTSNRIHVVPNGVGSEAPVTRVRSGPDGARILFLSNMISSKGPLVLVKALGLLKAKGVKFKATFAGRPAEPDCVEQFHRDVSALGLETSVTYVGGVYGEAKTSLYRDHDIFAFPTSYPKEAFPLVILEAMQHGLPVVTTNEGAIADIVGDGETGFIVPPSDPEALARKLEELVVDEALRTRLGDEGRARYLESYTSARFERHLVDALRSCVG